jgi:pSer/pThr/pTyr-binding forkhead associated (FHA) protein
LTPSSAGGVTVDDNGGTTKVFRRLSSPTQLREGDEFRVGESLVIYDGTNAVPQRGDFGRIVVCPHDGRPASAHAIGPDGLLMGRQVGDVTFEADTFVSSEHCRISITGTAVVLEDLDSSNGTHIRIRTGERVPVGSLLLIGQTQFEVRAL